MVATFRFHFSMQDLHIVVIVRWYKVFFFLVLQMSELMHHVERIEWNRLDELCELLQPFKMITAEMSGQEYVTISSVAPYQYKLLHHLENRDADSAFIQHIKNIMRLDHVSR